MQKIVLRGPGLGPPKFLHLCSGSIRGVRVNSIFKKLPAVLPPEVAAAGCVVAAGVAPRVAAHPERDAQPPLHVLVKRAPSTQPGSKRIRTYGND